MIKWPRMHPVTYLRTFWFSLTSPQYYVDVLNTKLWFSVRFFLISVISLGVLFGIWLSFWSLPQWRETALKDLQTMRAEFPAKLELRWDPRAGLSSNSNKPLEIPYPRVWQLPTTEYHSFGVIAPNVEEPDQIAKEAPASSWWVVGKRALYLHTPGDESWVIYPLIELPEFDKPITLNQATLPEISTKLESGIADATTGAQVVTPIFTAVFFLFLASIDTLSHAGLAILLFWLLGYRLGALKTLQVCLHIGVIAFLVQVLTWVFFPLLSIGMFSISFWMYLFVLSLTLQHVEKQLGS